jgi:selenocysteine lyase/cysteine desulfurase
MLSAVAIETRTFFDDLRDREFSRLDAQQHAYLDYGGSALYAGSQLRAHHALLRDGIFGNPHSDSEPSRASTEIIDATRRRVLRFFDVDESTHDVCFTANTSAAIKLVAESYAFSSEAACVLSADNHNSVNGIREYAGRAGARIRYIPLDGELRLFDADVLLAEQSLDGGGLVAFPAQSNFSGVQHPLDLVTKARALGFDVLLDAAAFVPSHALSLRRCPADFVAISFYKLFGYPTGIGALVARREALARLRRPWFAGGTVVYASVAADTHRLRPRHAAFEDGTPDFLSIAALDAGFDLLAEVKMPRLTAHLSELTRDLLDYLAALRHTNGMPLVRIYGPSEMTARGGAVAFNVCNRDGTALSYSLVETRARRANVSVRGGCFCNPGASESAFGLDVSRIAPCFENLGDTFTPERFAACTNTAVGAVRISIGMANNREDIQRAVAVIASFRE